MKIWKIITALTILFLFIGMVSATDINNLKVPDGWKALGGGSYHEEGDSPGQGSGQNMMIQKWDDSFKEEYYQNITEEQYTVTDTGNNTYMYIDDFNEDARELQGWQRERQPGFPWQRRPWRQPLRPLP